MAEENKLTKKKRFGFSTLHFITLASSRLLSGVHFECDRLGFVGLSPENCLMNTANFNPQYLTTQSQRLFQYKLDIVLNLLCFAIS
ncbi:hypothetical protein ACF3DV_26065 [Chlorogloeopsis fritschii PCC 9212]|uniref:hypothetical protein n=1 Tax=Chlorogloeopsis fritschii TaxID=1124 RepID=UPI0002FC702C|nr:hypothetical protein [Chlorogloeopsis fritschii]